LFSSPELPSSTCQKYPLTFQKLEFVKKVQNTDVAIASKGPKTPIRKIENKSPRKHVAIKNKDSKSISCARNLGSMYGWENADPPNVLDVATKRSKEEGDQKTANLKRESDVIEVITYGWENADPPNVLDVATKRSKEEGDQKTTNLKLESDVIEVIEAEEHEERLLLKAKRKERKKQKKTDKRRAQMMNLAQDSNLVDSTFEPMNETSYEGDELVVEQTKVISSQQEQGVLNSQSYFEETTTGIPSSSTFEKITPKLFSFENTLVVSCSVALIGLVLSIFIYNAVNFVEIS
jgi:hypothetical protein